MPVGRLDLATSGLLILTNDTQFANWLTDPASEIPRVYLVTVEGRGHDEAAVARLTKRPRWSAASSWSPPRRRAQGSQGAKAT